jgi:hypothetical protein
MFFEFFISLFSAFLVYFSRSRFLLLEVFQIYSYIFRILRVVLHLKIIINWFLVCLVVNERKKSFDKFKKKNRKTSRSANICIQIKDIVYMNFFIFKISLLSFWLYLFHMTRNCLGSVLVIVLSNIPNQIIYWNNILIIYLKWC